MDLCPLCEEPVTRAELADSKPISTEGVARLAHRECMLRTVIGGIGHLEDHAYWCSGRHDPDGGRSFRQSALEVDQWCQTWVARRKDELSTPVDPPQP